MKDNLMINMHRSAQANHLELYSNGLYPDGEMSPQEVAFSILQHSGMLYRYTADESIISSLTKLDTNNLLENGFEYVRSLELIEVLQASMNTEPVNDYQLMDLEYIIGVRDELEAFCNTAQQIIADGLARGDLSFASDLAAARAYAREFDRIAAMDPGLISVAADTFSVLKDYFAIECSRKDYWWMYLSEMYESAESALADNIKRLTDVPGVRDRILHFYSDDGFLKSRENESSGNFAAMHSIDFEALFHKAVVPAAAADESQLISAVVLWDGTSNCFSICETTGEGDPEEAKCYAKLVTEITHTDDGNALAEWQIHGFDFAGRVSTDFYILARDIRKVVGTGSVDSEGYAVLKNAFWEELNHYSSNYDKLILLVVLREPPVKDT